jgi:hypothetical protein
MSDATCDLTERFQPLLLHDGLLRLAHFLIRQL